MVFNPFHYHLEILTAKTKEQMKQKNILSNLHFLSKIHSKRFSALLRQRTTITCAASLKEDIPRFRWWTEIFLNITDFNMREDIAKETSVTSIDRLLRQNKQTRFKPTYVTILFCLPSSTRRTDKWKCKLAITRTSINLLFQPEHMIK